MTKTVIQLVALAMVLILLQVLCSKIVLFGVATPIIFIYLILRLPVTLSRNWVYTIAFFMGLMIDIFNNTQGMNALACTLLAAVRQPVFRAFVPRQDDMTNPMPSIESLGLGVYLKYMSTMTLIYCALLFIIQLFTFSRFLHTLLHIVTSCALSIVLILAIDSLMSTRREKRL